MFVSHSLWVVCDSGFVFLVVSRFQQFLSLSKGLRNSKLCDHLFFYLYLDTSLFVDIESLGEVPGLGQDDIQGGPYQLDNSNEVLSLVCGNQMPKIIYDLAQKKGHSSLINHQVERR